MTRRGPAKAVDNISFSIAKNETLGLIGESGCGKTTTDMSLMRFIKPPGQIVGGSIRYMGKDIAPMTDEQIRQLRGKEISIVRQEAQNALNPVLTIGKQITEMILEHESVTRETALARAKKQLNLVGISDGRIKSYPHEFSGGMKQRAMAAIATACNPKFLILDEPTTGLDVIVQRQILVMLRNLNGRQTVQESGISPIRKITRFSNYLHPHRMAIKQPSFPVRSLTPVMFYSLTGYPKTNGKCRLTNDELRNSFYSI